MIDPPVVLIWMVAVDNGWSRKRMLTPGMMLEESFLGLCRPHNHHNHHHPPADHFLSRRRFLIVTKNSQGRDAHQLFAKGKDRAPDFHTSS
jgi:hypothetical protein